MVVEALSGGRSGNTIVVDEVSNDTSNAAKNTSSVLPSAIHLLLPEKAQNGAFITHRSKFKKAKIFLKKVFRKNFKKLLTKRFICVILSKYKEAELSVLTSGTPIFSSLVNNFS